MGLNEKYVQSIESKRSVGAAMMDDLHEHHKYSGSFMNGDTSKIIPTDAFNSIKAFAWFHCLNSQKSKKGENRLVL